MNPWSCKIGICLKFISRLHYENCEIKFSGFYQKMLKNLYASVLCCFWNIMAQFHSSIFIYEISWILIITLNGMFKVEWYDRIILENYELKQYFFYVYLSYIFLFWILHFLSRFTFSGWLEYLSQRIRNRRIYKKNNAKNFRLSRP